MHASIKGASKSDSSTWQVTRAHVLAGVEQLGDDVVGVAAPHQIGELVGAEAHERGEQALPRHRRAREEEARLHHVAPEPVQGQARHVRRHAVGDGHLEELAAVLDGALQEVVAELPHGDLDGAVQDDVLESAELAVPRVHQAFCQAPRPERREEQLVDDDGGELYYDLAETK
jgi:hypothetical protein